MSFVFTINERMFAIVSWRVVVLYDNDRNSNSFWRQMPEIKGIYVLCGTHCISASGPFMLCTEINNQLN